MVGWMSSLTGTDETLACRGYGGTFVTLNLNPQITQINADYKR